MMTKKQRQGDINCQERMKIAELIQDRFVLSNRSTLYKARKIEYCVDDTQKLHKILAEAGFGSRREMEKAIIAGQISVNGIPAHIGQRVALHDEVRVNGQLISCLPSHRLPRVLLYNKPLGEIVSRCDPKGRSSVFDNLPIIKLSKWISVGRLDYNSEGLLLFTDSGELANRLAHPRYQQLREYAVRVFGKLDSLSCQCLLQGVELEDGVAKFLKMEVVESKGHNCWCHVSIGEGRNREIRRMFGAVNCSVNRLIRTRYGNIKLPRNLYSGQWMELDSHHTRHLMQDCGLL